jgi:hypothetical protein
MLGFAWNILTQASRHAWIGISMEQQLGNSVQLSSSIQNLEPHTKQLSIPAKDGLRPEILLWSDIKIRGPCSTTPHFSFASQIPVCMT